MTVMYTMVYIPHTLSHHTHSHYRKACLARYQWYSQYNQVSSGISNKYHEVITRRRENWSFLQKVRDIAVEIRTFSAKED